MSQVSYQLQTINDTFSSFGLSEAMLSAISRKGWTAPSSIQRIALPRLLADEGHLIVKARTGTGKTAAFGIPLIEKLTQAGRAPRALILAPTRELALQVSREIASLVSGPYPRICAVYGGASIRNQILELRRGAEIVAGTPGRIMDLMERKALDLSAVDWFILDEADEMLDMGFLEDVEKILSAIKPEGRLPPEEAAPGNGKALPFRMALFSATMPEAILRVVREHIGKVEIIEDSAPEDEKPAVDQFCMILKREDKLEALRRIIDGAAEFYGLVFCATKAETDELARRLVEAGYPAEAIHGDLSQEVRERALRRFRLHRVIEGGEAAIMVATDVAARGIDIEGLTHVINWDLPNDHETYVHRIGRTGRAGRRGVAVSLALPAERGRISHLSRSMERSLGSGILWLKVPSVKSVMKALRRRIVSAVVSVLPEAALPGAVQPDTEAALTDTAAVPEMAAESRTTPENPAITAAPDTAEPADAVSPFLAKVCRQLIERLGAERAVEALISLSYGELLDPARYGPVTEFSEEDFRSPVRGRDREESGRKRGRPLAGTRRAPGKGGRGPGSVRGPGSGHENAGTADFTRVYVGLGRRHGAGPRDVAGLLMRAGGIPGRLVDEIEMKDYCAFASLPADAAKRACAFSQNEPNDPVIKLAHPVNGRPAFRR